MAAAGVALTVVFQLAHTVEGPEFPLPAMPENMLPEEFAMHQIATTANFATSNRLVTWLVGGLNFQIEHHLFPESPTCIIRRSARWCGRYARSATSRTWSTRPSARPWPRTHGICMPWAGRIG